MSDEAGLFGPDSVSWQVHREVAVLFGGARALLMQAAHPLVIAGARQTRLYERNPWKRLERTLALQYAITFGTEAEALAAAERINRVHRDVHGIDSVTGLPYDAMDPDLLLWVHACLVDSSLLFERLAVGRLDDEGRERFHREQMVGAELLGLDRSRIPPTVVDLRGYSVEAVAAGDALRVTPDALAVADLIRHPPPEVPWRPVLRQVAWWAFSTLPPDSVSGTASGGARSRSFGFGAASNLEALRPVIPYRFREILAAQTATRRIAQAA